jgi:Flp pilus assembly pilin Flp
MTRLLIRWLADERGQDLVEYMLLGLTVGFASLVVMNTFGDVMKTVYDSWDSGTQAIWEPQDPQP